MPIPADVFDGARFALEEEHPAGSEGAGCNGDIYYPFFGEDIFNTYYTVTYTCGMSYNLIYFQAYGMLRAMV